MQDNNNNRFNEWALILAIRACLAFLAATTMIVTHRLGYSFSIENGLGVFWGTLITNAFVAVVYLSVDWILEMIVFMGINNASTGDEWKKKKKSQRQLVRLTVTYGLILLCVTGTMSIWSMKEVSYGLVEKPNTGDLDQKVEEIKSIHLAELNSIDADLQKLRGNESSRVRKVKREHHKLIQGIINSGTSYQQAAWYKSRSWLLSLSKKSKKHKRTVNWRESIFKAKKDSANAVAVELAKVSQLEAAKSDLFNRSNDRDKTIASLITTKTQMLDDYKSRVSNLSSFLIYVDICVASMVVFLSILLFKLRQTNGRQVHEQTGGIVSAAVNVCNIVFAVLSNIANRVAERINNRFKLNVALSTGESTVQHKRQRGATPGKPSSDSSKKGSPKPMSHKDDSSSIPVVKYLDLKNPINKATQRYRRAAAAGDWERCKQIEKDTTEGFAYFQSLGFDVSFDRSEGKASVRQPKGGAIKKL